MAVVSGKRGSDGKLTRAKSYRYWRITDISIPGGGYLEISELQFLKNGVVVNDDGAKTSSTPPEVAASTYPFSMLFDGIIGSSSRTLWYESTAEDPSFWIKIDFGANTNVTPVNGIKQAGYSDSDRYMDSFRLEASQDDTVWHNVKYVTNIPWTGQYTLSSEYDTSNNDVLYA